MVLKYLKRIEGNTFPGVLSILWKTKRTFVISRDRERFPFRCKALKRREACRSSVSYDGGVYDEQKFISCGTSHTNMAAMTDLQIPAIGLVASSRFLKHTFSERDVPWMVRVRVKSHLDCLCFTSATFVSVYFLNFFVVTALLLLHVTRVLFKYWNFENSV